MLAYLSSVPANILPCAINPERVALGWDRLSELWSRQPDDKRFFDALQEHALAKRLLDGIFSASPYLADCIFKEPDTLARLCQAGPDAALDAVFDDLAALRDARLPQAGLMRPLRQAKRRAALAIAWGDITGWPLEKVTGGLSRLAEMTLDAAMAGILQEFAARGALRFAEGSDALRQCGYTAIGMGKLGARELNYSSDIDLIMLYEPDRLAAGDDPYALRQTMVRVTQALVTAMQGRTADGYVFRTDLRLRPDPGATPVAMPVAAAETYYESMGQNWERAAMIKARPVAGDLAAGDGFLTHIRPFIWRKHLDFWAIQDIHSIKRQINAFRGGKAIAVDGHDIKIGRGGIREIEFYAQTLQLIWGGRQPALRLRETKKALAMLAETGHAEEQAVADLTAAYDVLRRVEHRLQMLEDAQTQTLPDTEQGIATMAAFLGFDSADAFRRSLRATLERVERHYAALFEESPDLGGGGALVFTGGEDHPDTLANLKQMGFEDPSRVSAVIRSWHTGRYRAFRSTRAREILTEIIPALLQAFGKHSAPDEAFMRFDAFLSALPAGVQLLSLIQSNPDIVEFLARIMGDAPRLADRLARYPVLLESVLSEGFFEPIPPKPRLRTDLAMALADARDLQDTLDMTRRWSNDRRFQIGMQMLQGRLSGSSTGPALSDLADLTLEAMLHEVERDFARTHGRVKDGTLAAMAYGKLGGRELSPGSDLDIVFLYDHAPDAADSDGQKPLPPSLYFQRLAQRVITAMSSMTGEGKLYEIDARLRPHGNKGSIATPIDAWRKYYEEEAWTWEFMALTRARAAVGARQMLERMEATRRAVLALPRDMDRLLRETAAMRRRMRDSFPGNDPWDVKHRPGGMVDAEFTVQYLILRHAAAHPGIMEPAALNALPRLIEAGLIGQEQGNDLIAGLTLWRDIQAMIRLTCPNGGFRPDNSPQGQRALIAQAAGGIAFEVLPDHMDVIAARVRAVYEAIVEGPAAALPPMETGEKAP